jgi:hypothetical protein
MAVQGWPDAVACRGCGNRGWYAPEGVWTCTACFKPMHPEPTADPATSLIAMGQHLARISEGMI